MGGRGAKSGLSGRRMSLKRLLDNFRTATINDVNNLKLNIHKAEFSNNGNSVRIQIADVKDVPNGQKVILRFRSGYDPRQIATPRDYIKTGIDMIHMDKDGNVDGMRTLVETKTKSNKNAKKNHENIIDQWKGITRQKTISF